MSYLWEDYDLRNEYVLALKGFCPYTEIFQSIDNVSRVNLLYRFFKIKNCLDDCFESEHKLKENLGENGINTMFHILANIDFFSGLSKDIIQMMSIYDEICNGYYGIDTKLFNKLTFKHTYKLLSYILLKKQSKGRDNLFFDCITELFDVDLNYSESTNTYIIEFKGDSDYMWRGDYSSKELYTLIKQVLCDFWIKVEDYWKVPIGIVGDEMRIDNIQMI